MSLELLSAAHDQSIPPCNDTTPKAALSVLVLLEAYAWVWKVHLMQLNWFKAIKKQLTDSKHDKRNMLISFLNVINLKLKTNTLHPHFKTQQ